MSYDDDLTIYIRIQLSRTGSTNPPKKITSHLYSPQVSLGSTPTSFAVLRTPPSTSGDRTSLGAHDAAGPEGGGFDTGNRKPGGSKPSGRERRLRSSSPQNPIPSTLKKKLIFQSGSFESETYLPKNPIPCFRPCFRPMFC